jgi:hypothetical protein
MCVMIGCAQDRGDRGPTPRLRPVSCAQLVGIEVTQPKLPFPSRILHGMGRESIACWVNCCHSGHCPGNKHRINVKKRKFVEITMACKILQTHHDKTMLGEPDPDTISRHAWFSRKILHNNFGSRCLFHPTGTTNAHHHPETVILLMMCYWTKSVKRIRTYLPSELSFMSILPGPRASEQA